MPFLPSQGILTAILRTLAGLFLSDSFERHGFSRAAPARKVLGFSPWGNGRVQKGIVGTPSDYAIGEAPSAAEAGFIWWHLTARLEAVPFQNSFRSSFSAFPSRAFEGW